MKQKTETPHRGQTVQGGMVINYNFREKKFITKPLHFENSVGWPRSCVQCGESFTLNYVACTVRDGRQELCRLCVFEGMRQRRWWR